MNVVSQRQRLISFSDAHYTLFLRVFYEFTVHVLLYGISDGINNFIINQATQEYLIATNQFYLMNDLSCVFY